MIGVGPRSSLTPMSMHGAPAGISARITWRRIWWWFTSTEVVYGVTGTEVTELPEYGVSP
jgi:hypothetical protein